MHRCSIRMRRISRKSSETHSNGVWGLEFDGPEPSIRNLDYFRIFFTGSTIVFVATSRAAIIATDAKLQASTKLKACLPNSNQQKHVFRCGWTFSKMCCPRGVGTMWRKCNQLHVTLMFHSHYIRFTFFNSFEKCPVWGGVEHYNSGESAQYSALGKYIWHLAT